MHEAYRYDENGDTVEAIPFCSDACSRQHEGEKYEGWNGCHESELTTYCAECGVVIPGLEDACTHQAGNVLVNRLPSEDGEKCAHGNWVQVPRYGASSG